MAKSTRPINGLVQNECIFISFSGEREETLIWKVNGSYCHNTWKNKDRMAYFISHFLQESFIPWCPWLVWKGWFRKIWRTPTIPSVWIITIYLSIDVVGIRWQGLYVLDDLQPWLPITFLKSDYLVNPTILFH